MRSIFFLPSFFSILEQLAVGFDTSQNGILEEEHFLLRFGRNVKVIDGVSERIFSNRLFLSYFSPWDGVLIDESSLRRSIKRISDEFSPMRDDRRHEGALFEFPCEVCHFLGFCLRHSIPIGCS